MKETRTRLPWEHELLRVLDSRKIGWSWAGFSALDRYYRGRSRATAFSGSARSLPHESISVSCDLGELARCGFELAFPGIEGVDAMIPLNDLGGMLFIILEDSFRSNPALPLALLGSRAGALVPTGSAALQRGLVNGRQFIFPSGLYAAIRDRSFCASLRTGRENSDPSLNPIPGAPDWQVSLARAGLLSRYSLGSVHHTASRSLDDSLGCRNQAEEDYHQAGSGNRPESFNPVLVRYYLDLLLSGPEADLGLDYLKCSTHFMHLLPELQPMEATLQAKDHHPEGDVWRHSLEALRYRKNGDLRLSWSLLLHDSGKPHSQPEKGKRFAGHTQLGADLARQILLRFDYPAPFIEDVQWIVENHMYPPVLGRLPMRTADRLMEDHRFPLLLEHYRCDISSSFSGPQNYHRACELYNRFLKDRGLKRYRPEKMFTGFSQDTP